MRPFPHRFGLRDRVSTAKKETMSNLDEVLTIAHHRGRDTNLPYAGAVTPAEAYQLVLEHPQAILVDVRTNAERDWIGKVAIPEVKHAAVQWNFYPGPQPNQDFIKQLKAVADTDSILLFLCRSAVRSHHAAKLATESGYHHCFNILEGFEGDRDAAGHRKTIGGWCQAGLPWIGA